VTNVGWDDLVIREMVITDGGQGAFGSPDAGATVIGPDESRIVTVVVRPPIERPVEGRLILRSNDPDEPEVDVVLRAE